MIGPRKRNIVVPQIDREGCEMSDAQGYGRDRQSAIYRAGVSGRRPAVPTDFAALSRLAKATQPA